ncbi:MAG: 50S ribosomal protein L22 [Parcubacteria group bacterium RIFCSPHIGHO2_01_FULL_56_18]|nr:MAG: 50S ribosomal protein L22 [Parcubacteria group bacterium RIFCSPHIGHO2_01_FULL_56_18]
MHMKASLYNFKQSPRKVRLVADMIRGKRVMVARDMLAFMPKKSSPEIEKLLASAIANARQAGMNPEDLVVKTISVDKGAVLKRFKPMARGRAASVRRTMSIVKIELGTVAAFVKKAPKTEANAEAEKKPAAKKPRAKKAAK